jgi:hypothetical protein
LEVGPFAEEAVGLRHPTLVALVALEPIDRPRQVESGQSFAQVTMPPELLPGLPVLVAFVVATTRGLVAQRELLVRRTAALAAPKTLVPAVPGVARTVGALASPVVSAVSATRVELAEPVVLAKPVVLAEPVVLAKVVGSQPLAASRLLVPMAEGSIRIQNQPLGDTGEREEPAAAAGLASWNPWGQNLGNLEGCHHSCPIR